jgi:CRP/FNR family transcriptional regulator
MESAIDKALSGSELEESLKNEILNVGRLKKVQAGQVLITQGSENHEIPIVIDGVLRVTRHDEKGNEMFLYYLEGGETCAMSVTCCLEGKRSNFSAVAEENTSLWMIPMAYMNDWLTRYPSFRKFIFSSYQMRFEELLNAIDSVAFMRMDERLYKYLLDKKQASGSYVINKTHEQIALELNTSRVVVSRLLKKLEGEGKIEQYRNRIEVL